VISRRDRIRKIYDLVLADDDLAPGRRGSLWRFGRKYLAPVAGRLLLAFAAILISSAQPYVFSLTWRFLVDRVVCLGRPIAPEEAPRHMELALIFFAMNMSIWTTWLALSWTRSWLVLSAGRTVVFNLRRDLYNKLQSLAIGFYERTPPGRILSRVLDDVNVIHQWMTGEGVTFLVSVAQIIYAGALLTYLEADLVVVALVGLPIHALAFLSLRPKFIRAHLALRKLTGRMYAISTERISAVGVVKAFRREKAEVAGFARLAHSSVRMGVLTMLYSHGLDLIAGVIAGGTLAVAAYMGAERVKAGSLSPGGLSAFLIALSHTFHAVRMASTHLANMQGLSVAVSRAFALLDEKEEVLPGRRDLESVRGRIRFDNVSFAYPGQKSSALDCVSFEVRPGERVALMGPSGAGKTTVFQLLMRFYDPQSGKVFLDDADLSDVSPESLRRHVCMVLQEPVVFASTIGEAVAYGRVDATPAAIMRAAEQAELHEFVMSLPLKYETEIGERGVTLSGGQRQRLALATALLTEPEVLLLDDTTSALDAATEARIQATLRRVLAGRTSIIITHRVSTARGCDRIIVLERGRVVQEGTHDELSRRDGFYRRICMQQSAPVGSEGDGATAAG
jgi:ABC-type multidrug transport system fused ATPase/permease subunit